MNNIQIYLMKREKSMKKVERNADREDLTFFGETNIFVYGRRRAGSGPDDRQSKEINSGACLRERGGASCRAAADAHRKNEKNSCGVPRVPASRICGVRVVTRVRRRRRASGDHAHQREKHL